MGINKNSNSGNLHIFDEKQYLSEQLFYKYFNPIDECYYIQLLNSNKYWSVNKKNFQVKLINNKINEL